MQTETTHARFRELVVTVRESLSGRQHDYTTGPLRRAILLLAIPMILEMAMESVFAVTAAVLFRRGTWKMREV